MGGGFKEDDAVWKEPTQPKNEQLPELKVGDSKRLCQHDGGGDLDGNESAR